MCFSTFHNFSAFDAIKVFKMTEDEGKKTKESRWRIYDTTYETIDFDRHDNNLFEKFLTFLSNRDVTRLYMIRFVLIIAIAFLVSCLAILTRLYKTYLVSFLLKSHLLQLLASDFPNSLPTAFGGWTLYCLVSMAIASALCIFIEPKAGGNDISDTTAFFNGVLIKNQFTLKTLVVMFTSMLAQIHIGTFASEVGPIIKLGAAVGYLLPKVLRSHKMMFLREGIERRNFALCGMAAGLSSVLNAPIAGTLLAVEHTHNNYGAQVIADSFVCAFLAKIFTQIALTGIFPLLLHKYSIDANPFATFGRIRNEDVTYTRFEFIVYILVGILGGILGSLWNQLSLLVTRLRDVIWSHTKIILYLETLVWAAVAACFQMFLLYIFRTQPCVNIKQLDEITRNVTSPHEFFVMPSITCPSDNDMPQVGILMISPDHIITFMVHAIPGTFSLVFLAILTIFLYIFGVFYVGLCIATGIFVSHAILGTLWGRLFGEVLNSYANAPWSDPKKFALLGAAAQMTGVFHYGLVAIAVLIETTGSYQAYTIPLLITTVTAHCVAYVIGEKSYYVIILEYMGIPFLSPVVPYGNITAASKFMTQPIIHLPLVPTVKEIMRVLNLNKGRYPIYSHDNLLLGDISRTYLCAIIMLKIQDKTQQQLKPLYLSIHHQLSRVDCSIEYYEKTMRRLNQELTNTDYEKRIRLKPFMNHSIYTISAEENLAGAYTYIRQTRAHTLYVTQNGHVLGVITRKDVIDFNK
ncbi:hypothetical protein M8J76_005989 [Diaphorina citri]|nr:hypothetical protein M8J76_005989 [Diaphorina citri]